MTQRVAFGGVIEANAPSGPSAVQRLQDVLQKLEIAPLKRLQAQIQQLIDGEFEHFWPVDASFAGHTFHFDHTAVVIDNSNPRSFFSYWFLMLKKGLIGQVLFREIQFVSLIYLPC